MNLRTLVFILLFMNHRRRQKRLIKTRPRKLRIGLVVVETELGIGGRRRPGFLVGLYVRGLVGSRKTCK